MVRVVSVALATGHMRLSVHITVDLQRALSHSLLVGVDIECSIETSGAFREHRLVNLFISR
jgi:hypothetical protein